MEAVALTDTRNYPDIFRHHILINIEYWRDYAADHATDIPALDAERERIIRAIVFGLDLQETWPQAWPLVYDLVTGFSPYVERRGSWDVWNQLLERAVEAAQQVEDLAGAITLSVLLARLLQRQSRLKEAIARYRQVIPLARRSKNLFEEARACTNLGYLYIEQDHWQRAEVLCCYALTIFERINSNHGRAHTENHLGFLYTRQGLWDRARQHLERACALWQAMEDNHSLMRGFINLGLLYTAIERPYEAIASLDKALYSAMLTGEEVEIGKIYVNMGLVHRLYGELAQAEEYIWQAEAIFRRFSNLSDLVLTWINLGLIYTKQEKWEEANNYLEAALQLCRHLKNKQGEFEALVAMTEYELVRGNQQQAAARLREVEHFVQSRIGEVQYRHLQALLNGTAAA